MLADGLEPVRLLGCGSVPVIYRRFGGMNCLHPQG
jgi:hypothetical protein